ncbi:MAG: hypothetical protein A2W90_14210 [Bacteroidetes bacterium GWF2_42_66]|nr:MAG: hypothetical protein A2W92_17310 [Bacteroidetes bacterium GWA2_42_15]OFX96623.1 MAG: hypothetical protein A2W89_02300 [Bacteroidetes bacterium GWE2_42_39]OFY45370.1 MAG: hypothetical protein A2W90_14210 [Bacteroidetes bacterium GWF2_42_66]HBL76413.1 hypothetical protein [Prolixibacteraceae bacterium]HCU60961.1 hypothetical protein [Prolixibacteraceae bacterium]
MKTRTKWHTETECAKNLQARLKISLILILVGTTMGYAYAQKDRKPKWTHFYIAEVLPGSEWGTGGPALGDFDHDGDLDAAVSRRNTQQAYWYERINDSIWIPHVMDRSENLAKTLGNVSIDMDRDGWMDVVFEGVWFRNPGTLEKQPDTPWKGNDYKGGGHDITIADMDGNKIKDLVVYDGNKLAWYDAVSLDLKYRNLNENIIGYGYHDHGGIAPGGIGDLDGDGDPDAVIPGYWFANPGSGVGDWDRHEWPYQEVLNASYPRGMKSWVADINQDGQNDIVYSDCDTGGSHVYWVENKGRGSNWESHRLADPPTKAGDVPGTGSFHSLGVADFDQDGNLDIFAGEQEDPATWMEKSGKVAMKPRGLKERGVIWYSRGGKEPEFEIDVIHVDNPGWHDAQLGDVDGDGDLDIVSKVWSADGVAHHADYWRNELKK